MPELSPARRRELKARAHVLDPVVLIGGEGLSSSVLAEIDRGLKAHELGDDSQLDQLLLELPEDTVTLEPVALSVPV